MPDLENLTPAQREALEDCFHQSDLIGRLPLPCEIEWAVMRVSSHDTLTAAAKRETNH